MNKTIEEIIVRILETRISNEIRKLEVESNIISRIGRNTTVSHDNERGALQRAEDSAENPSIKESLEIDPVIQNYYTEESLTDNELVAEGVKNSDTRHRQM